MLAPLRKERTRSSCRTTTRTFLSLTTFTERTSTPWATSPVASSKVAVAAAAGAATTAAAVRASPTAPARTRGMVVLGIS